MRAFLLISVSALVLATTAAGAGRRAADSLNLDARVTVSARELACPPGGPQGAECYSFHGSAAIPGLGRVSYQRGMFTVGSADGSNTACAHVSFGPITLTVAGKGEIDASISVDPACNGVPTGFVVTGGSGSFSAVSGSGAFVPSIVQAGHWVDPDDNNPEGDDITGDWRTETWTGALIVPGYTFDLTPPVISGARSKAVSAPKGARHVRVRFTVKAKDAVDGAIPATCRPRSGALFRIGTTGVKCSATDSSVNTAHAHFTVTVRRRR